MWYPNADTTFNPIPLIESCLFCYVAGLLVFAAVYFASIQYRFSTAYRKILKKAGFFEAIKKGDEFPNTNSQQDVQYVARMMREVLSFYPSTVSELVHEQQEHHGAIFKAFMVVAGVFLLKVDLNVMSPLEMDQKAWILIVLNVIRMADFVGGVFGFPFAYVWRRWFNNFNGAIKKHGPEDIDKNWPEELVDLGRRNFIFGIMHQIFAFPLFLFSPLIDLAIGVWSLSRFSTFTDFCTITWFAIRVVKCFTAVSCLACLSGFFKSAKQGMLYPGEKAMKTFWFEFRTVQALTHLLILLPFDALFDQTRMGRFTSLNEAGNLNIAAVIFAGIAGAHVLYVGHFCFNTYRAVFTDEPYGNCDSQYVKLFKAWRETERTMTNGAKLMAEDYKGQVDPSAGKDKIEYFIQHGHSKNKPDEKKILDNDKVVKKNR